MNRSASDQYLKTCIESEIALADELIARGDHGGAVQRLERAHVLGQSLTGEHTRIHWHMLRLGIMMKKPREVIGQLLRIAGAVTKTPFGIYPKGNTGGSDVYFFRSMPVPDDLKQVLQKAGRL